MRVQIDGAPASAEALQHRVLSNYGHFSSMQVRDGRVRGLQRHLARMRAATRELFDAELDGDRVRHLIRAALAQDRSGTVRVDVFRAPAAADAARAGMPTLQRPVHLAELASFRGVFVANSLGVVPVGLVDQTALAIDSEAIGAVQWAYDAVGWDQI